MKTKHFSHVRASLAEIKLRWISEYFTKMEAKFTKEIQSLEELFDIETK